MVRAPGAAAEAAVSAVVVVEACAWIGSAKKLSKQM
jgi:hypothetical protein